VWSYKIIVGFSPDYGFTDKCVANLTQEFYRYLFDRCISICIIFTNSKRFRIDAKIEPFFMSMTIHPKFIKTELKLV